jgi:NAD(P)-dependent dehydrogenase (short-subunit alcohol dehydrogenase family)
MTSQDISNQIPAIRAGNVAVITGGASGIGLAAAKTFAALGMKVAIADLGAERVRQAANEVAGSANISAGDVLGLECDVSKSGDLAALAKAVTERFGKAPSVLMNNAGVGNNPGKPWENLDAWRKLIDINFWGATNGVGAFAEDMIPSGEPGLIINTGSKQGITTPPGNLAYNVSKAALKTYTEGLAHELRNTPGCQVSAHLLIPGFTFTGLTTGATEKPAGAWTGQQVVDFMLESLACGDFYILCPDNEVKRPTDEKRMAWAIGDIIENRPALSRWHPRHKEAFEQYMKD